MIPQNACRCAYGTSLVVAHHVVSCELLVCFQRQRLEAANVLIDSDLDAMIHYLAELVKQMDNVPVGRVELLYCFDRQHVFYPYLQYLRDLLTRTGS